MADIAANTGVVVSCIARSNAGVLAMARGAESLVVPFSGVPLRSGVTKAVYPDGERYQCNVSGVIPRLTTESRLSGIIAGAASDAISVQIVQLGGGETAGDVLFRWAVVGPIGALAEAVVGGSGPQTVYDGASSAASAAADSAKRAGDTFVGWLGSISKSVLGLAVAVALVALIGYIIISRAAS